MHRKHLIKLLGLSVLAIVAVMAMSASAAQANKYLLLLNHEHVNLLHLALTALMGTLKASGLTILCEGGTGEAMPESVNEEAGVEGTASGVLEGCEWVGSPNCTIKDPEAGVGKIKAGGTGKVEMVGENYYINTSSENYATIYTEGATCLIEEEMTIHGKAKVEVKEAGVDAVSHTAVNVEQELFLGSNPVEELTGEVHIKDALNSSATTGIDLMP